MPTPETATHANPEAGAPPPRLTQRLGLFSATAIVIGSMIGSGIFIVDADIARGVNSPALYMGAWIVTGIMTLIGAQLRRTRGHDAPGRRAVRLLAQRSAPSGAFSLAGRCSWSSRAGTIAAVAVAFGKFLGVLFPFDFRQPTGSGTSPMCPHEGGAPWCWATWRSASAPQIWPESQSPSSNCGEHLRRGSGRDCPEHLHHRQRRCRWRRSSCSPSSSAAAPSPRGPTSAPAGASSGRTPAGIPFTQCRSAWADLQSSSICL